MSEKFRVGIIGAGVISGYHSHAIEAQPDGVIVAVADKHCGSRETFAEKHKCECYEDYNKMLERDDIEAVHVCTPSGLHAEHAIASLKAGKHVLVEKSMAITIKDAVEMIKTAREYDRKLGVIFQKRVDEAPNRIKKAIADGLFGKIIFGDASIKYWRNEAYYDSADWRGTWAHEGGGATMTQGTHGIDILIYMMGDIEKIYAKMDTLGHGNIEVEDTAVAILTYKNGAYGRLQTATSCNPGQGNVIEINGTHGSVTLVEDTITSWAVSDSKETVAVETIVDVKGKAGTAASDSKTFPVEGFIKQVANFISAVRTGEELICSGEEGLRSLMVILGLYESARRGEEIYLSELLEGYDM